MTSSPAVSDCPSRPPLFTALSLDSLRAPLLRLGNWFHMVSAQERLTRTFTRSSHTYTRTERTEISKTRAGETKREVRVEESTQVGGEPFRDVFGDFLGRENLSGFNGRPPLQDGVCVFRRARVCVAVCFLGRSSQTKECDPC